MSLRNESSLHGVDLYFVEARGLSVSSPPSVRCLTLGDRVLQASDVCQHGRDTVRCVRNVMFRRMPQRALTAYQMVFPILDNRIRGDKASLPRLPAGQPSLSRPVQPFRPVDLDLTAPRASTRA